MREDICTIPISEVFDPKQGCPICRLRRTIEEHLVDYITGAAMMEPDVRMETNRLGFCLPHYRKLLDKRNRLSVALMLQTHMNETEEKLKRGRLKKSDILSCFICEKIDWSMERMLNTVFKVYSEEDEFRALYSQQEMLCLPHALDLLDGSKKVSRSQRGAFEKDTLKLTLCRSDEIKRQLSDFVEMFDYKNAGKGNEIGEARYSVENSIEWLTSSDVK